MRMLKILLCGLLLALPVLAEESDDRQTATSLRYVSHELDTRQNKLSAGTNAALTYTNTAGNVQQRTVKSDLTGGTTDTSLPMAEAVNAGLGTKQDDITTIDDHTAVTYTGQTGQIGQKGIYQTDGTYATQTNALIDAKTFNAALKNALDSEFVCADRPDAHDPNTNLCWLWEIHNETENKSPNLFDIDSIPELNSTSYQIHHNSDGSITVANNSDGNTSIPTEEKLSVFAPELEIGKTYVFSINTTGAYRNIYLQGANVIWHSGEALTMTQQMFDSKVHLYASGLHTTATIYNIQIEEGTTPTPFQPYNANVYIPQNQQ